MIANWQLWERGFSADWCDWVINEALEIAPRDAVVGFSSQKADEKIRRSQVRWITPDRENFRRVFDAMERMFRTANHNAFGADLWALREIQFTEYRAESSGFYDWHNDVNWDDGRAAHRKLSMIIQLTDPAEYEGGDFEMQTLYLGPPDAKKIKNRGAVLVFPSFLKHRVMPVTKGKRYSLVGWMEGPKWR